MSQSHRQPPVFVVDDEDVIASTLAMILRSQGGFEARAFAMPLDALEAAQLYAPDLLISDVVMPALSGIDLTIQVREHCPDCKVLLISRSGPPPRVFLRPPGRAFASGHRMDAVDRQIALSVL